MYTTIFRYLYSRIIYIYIYNSEVIFVYDLIPLYKRWCIKYFVEISTIYLYTYCSRFTMSPHWRRRQWSPRAITGKLSKTLIHNKNNIIITGGARIGRPRNCVRGPVQFEYAFAHIIYYIVSIPTITTV